MKPPSGSGATRASKFGACHPSSEDAAERHAGGTDESRRDLVGLVVLEDDDEAAVGQGRHVGIEYVSPIESAIVTSLAKLLPLRNRAFKSKSPFVTVSSR